MTLPKFVEYPGDQTVAGPILFHGMTMNIFALPCDHGKIAALCHGLIDTPSGGRVTFTPILDRVIMTFLGCQDARFLGHEYRGRGQERELSFGIPGLISGPDCHTEGYGMLMPFLFLDDPPAMLTGREEFGYFKQTGWITLPDDSAERGFAADIYGIEKFDPHTIWGRLNLVRVNDLGDAAAEQPTGILDVFAALGVRTLGLAESLASLTVRQIFLKQFRDIEDGNRACYQAITDTHYTIQHLHGFSLLNRHDVLFTHLDSTPVADVLGIPAHLQGIHGVKVTMDMQLQRGRVLWKA